MEKTRFPNFISTEIDSEKKFELLKDTNYRENS